MISFIMMAKNVEKYIGEAIVELQKEEKIPWELIIVDDHSSDSTYDIAKNYSYFDNRVKIFKNICTGKVLGTNYGYSLTSGEIIKCIDSDDVLLLNFFKEYENLKKYDAHCHGGYITDEKLNNIGVYNINPSLFNNSFGYVLSNLVSLPKSTWSFNRNIANKIFPMPESLPFEDVWMSISIKKHARKILRINKPLYLYRQHNTQTFGGIINYDKSRVLFRANRLLNLISVIKDDQRIMEGFDKNVFKKSIQYNQLAAKDALTFRDILLSELNFTSKLKLFVIRKIPFMAKYIILLKWKFDIIR